MPSEVYSARPSASRPQPISAGSGALVPRPTTDTGGPLYMTQPLARKTQLQIRFRISILIPCRLADSKLLIEVRCYTNIFRTVLMLAVCRTAFKRRRVECSYICRRAECATSPRAEGRRYLHEPAHVQDTPTPSNESNTLLCYTYSASTTVPLC